MARKKEVENYAEMLEREFARWEHIYEQGCTDPSWPDGVNLTLVRNHITYYKRKIIETMSPENYPEVYHRPDPPEVDGNYFARAEEIRSAAVQDLERYKLDGNLQFVRERYPFIHARDRANLGLDALLWRFLALQRAVQENDLQVMRRRRDAEKDLLDFADCAARIKAFSPQQTVRIMQMSLF